MDTTDHPGSTPGTDVPETTEESGGKPVYTVAAVNRAMDLLDFLSGSGPAGLAQIASAAGCTRTAAFRLLRTMAARGYVAQDGARGTWRLGDRFSAMLIAPPRQLSVPDVAAPVLTRIARETGRIVYLFRRRGMEATVAALFPVDDAQRRYAAVGDTFPLHAGCGRLLLAFAPEPVQTQVLAGRLSRFSPTTITDPRRLAAAIPITRERGWFTSQDELVPGSIAFSAPIRNSEGLADWMITISYPTILAQPKDRKDLLQAVVAAANEIEVALLVAPAD